MSQFPFAMVGFDLDGTLVDTQGDLGVALNHALGLIGREAIPIDQVAHLIGGGTRRMLQRALDETGGPLPDAQFTQLYPEVIAHYEANIAEHSLPYPGCIEALDALRDRDCALAVVTNKPERLTLKLLDALHLHSRFAAVIGGDTAERPKPHADPIELAIARCGGQGRFAMVGDSSFDIGAARAAGVPAVALSFGYNDLPPDELGADIVIDHYDELVPALRRL